MQQERKSFLLLSGCLADYVWHIVKMLRLLAGRNETSSHGALFPDKFVFEKAFEMTMLHTSFHYICIDVKGICKLKISKDNIWTKERKSMMGTLHHILE
jgi:hypothetical protein